MTILRDLLISSIHEGRQSMGYDKCLGLLTVRHLDGHAEEADAILLTPSCQALQQRLDALDAAEARIGEADRLMGLVDWLWNSQHQYHGGARESCRFEWCQRITVALAQQQPTGGQG